MKKIMVCAGTRPEIIKMAPVYHALKAAGAQTIMLHTGQHEEMAWPLYRFFDMPPTLCLTPRRKGASLAHLSASVLELAAEAMEAQKPDVVLVQGDTTSALMCAQAAYYARIPVGHVEAGLRTYEVDPFPEELNRQLIARMARWHFTPTEQATLNLRQEHVREGVCYVGNTVVDAVELGRLRLPDFIADDNAGKEVESFLLRREGRRLVLVTAHRRENWGEPMRRIASTVRQLVEMHDDLVWVWPMHQNPDVRACIREAFAGLPHPIQERLLLTDPLNYSSLLAALDSAYVILTDSGGIQEEAATLRRPVVVMRESTERQELIDAGGGVLVGTNPDCIREQMSRLLNDPLAHRAMQLATNPFGDGLASHRIAEIVGARA